MLTQKSMLAVLGHEAAYGGTRQHFRDERNVPRRPRDPSPREEARPQRYRWNERGEVLCFSLKQDRYVWVKPLYLASPQKRKKPA